MAGPPQPSERLEFRTWRPDDVELAVALWADPDVARFIQTAPPSRAGACARLAAEIALETEHRIQYWPIFLRAGGDHVGCAGLRPYRGSVLELGVHLRPGSWGQGLAREAARAVIDHAFTALGVPALFAGHNPDNAASRRMLSDLGFRYSHDELYPPTGRLHPSYRLDRP
jgi:ribosomal-protein-alanine N-acetyltransferase